MTEPSIPSSQTGDLRPQLWVERPEEKKGLGPEHFRPVFLEGAYPRVKPRGGLWTSTYDGDHGSGWVQWCMSEEFDCDRNDPTWESCWLLTPDPDARVYTIDTYADLEHLCRLYGRTDPRSSYSSTYPDWTLVAEAYDGVRLTDDGQWATRLSHPLGLYGWDCESTLWFRWAFASVGHLGRLTFTAKDPWWEEAAA